MKPRAIIADPLHLDRVGVTTTRQAAIFIHVGRCGLLGTTIPAASKVLGFHVSTVAQTMDALCEARLVTAYGRASGQGRAINYVVTGRGWEVLTAPADFSMFPHAQQALKKV